MSALVVCNAYEVKPGGLVLHMSSGHRLDDGTLSPTGHPDPDWMRLPNSLIERLEEYTDIEVVFHFRDGSQRVVAAEATCEVAC